MLVKHFFSSLHERLDKIEQEWTKGTSSVQQELYHQLLQLREVSDEILDHWLEFEERMVNLQHLARQTGNGADGQLEDIPDDVAEKILKEIKKLSSKPEGDQLISLLSESTARTFRMGRGYYHLYMYHDAARYFKQVLEQDPELDTARMYLAYSQLMSGELEEAGQHFRMVCHACTHPLLKATAENALGCILAAEEKWDQALSHFDKAVEEYPRLKDPLFNQALANMKLGFYDQAEQQWIQYCSEVKDDWEAFLLLADSCRALGKMRESEKVLAGISRVAQEPEILRQVGKRFEDIRQFSNAALCYQMLTALDPSSSSAWHGLGWNLWHAEGHTAGLNYIKKAVSLSPDNPDYLFSYGWILCVLQEFSKAEQTFRHILDREKTHPLAQAGLAQVFLAKEQWEAAEAACMPLLSMQEPLPKSLGHFQLGRLFLYQGDYSRAEHHLRSSMQESPGIQDGRLLLGLIRYLAGDKQEAMDIWGYSL